MGQDIRELLKNEQFFDNSQIPEMSKNHENSFLDKLNASFPEADQENESHDDTVVVLSNTKKRSFFIAASFTAMVAVSSFFFFKKVQQPADEIVYNLSKNTTEVVPSLAEVSPEFKEVEDYYLASINVELANLQINDDNRPVVDSFMKQLSRLDSEYKSLQKELHNEGAHEYTCLLYTSPSPRDA